MFNPIAKTEEIHNHYFNFFLTSFSPNNKGLRNKLRTLKGLRYLWKEPYISISKRYELGEDFEDFETERISDKVKLGFRNIRRLYRFQEEGIRNILNGRNTIISAGTGSGKTEVFLITILNYCFNNRKQPGIKAIMVYPMNALANDQVERLRKCLWFINRNLDRKITFAIYTGETPESTRELKEEFSGREENHIITDEDKTKELEEKRKIGCQAYCDGLRYDAENSRLVCKCGNLIIDYQKLTRKQIRENPPDILITNYVQLEHLLLRKKDEKLFSNGQVKFIVFDEIHAYKGARGIDVALLNRRLSLYHRMPTNVISIKLEGNKLFGVDIDNIFEKMKDEKPSLTREKFNRIFLITFKNAIINAAQRLLQTEDGEIEGDIKENEIIIYDNVDGGAGYVNEIVRRFDDILREAAEIVLDSDDECETGCLDCLWSYRRKRDIKFIDKRFIKEVFEAIEKHFLTEGITKEGKIKKLIEYKGENIRTIHSPPYDFSGIHELKKLLRGAKEEIILTSLYVTDDKIPWQDEMEKSWVDILIEIKLSSPTLKVTVIVREPTSEKHLLALKKLSEYGINVKIFKKEIENMLPSIVHSKLIVIDPHIPSARYAIHTSANFSPEMWKNHETFDFGNDEEWVKGTYREIKKIAKQSFNFKG